MNLGNICSNVRILDRLEVVCSDLYSLVVTLNNDSITDLRYKNECYHFWGPIYVYIMITMPCSCLSNYNYSTCNNRNPTLNEVEIIFHEPTWILFVRRKSYMSEPLSCSVVIFVGSTCITKIHVSYAKAFVN